MIRKTSFKALCTILIILIFASIAFEVDGAKRVRVKGYYRKDGTYVRPHYRTAPDGNPYNNYSFPGNYNPNTGKITPGNSQTYLDRYYNRSKTSTNSLIDSTLGRKSILQRSTDRNSMPKNTSIEAFRTKYASTLRLSFQELQAILAIKIYDEFYNATILADNNKRTYLGKISNTNEHDSIFYKYGIHGSEYGINSIWNTNGLYGSDFGIFSPFNDTTISPPLIVKNNKIIGYLSVNTRNPYSVNPYLLKAILGEK